MQTFIIVMFYGTVGSEIVYKYMLSLIVMYLEQTYEHNLYKIVPKSVSNFIISLIVYI